MFTYRKLVSVFASLIVIFSLTFSGFQPLPVSAQSGGDGRRQVNPQQSGDGLKRQVNPKTGRVSFIGPKSGRMLPAAKALGTFIRPQDPAQALVNRYAPEFGIKDPGRELSEMKSNRPADGRVTVRYQQMYQGIPVLGGELIVNTNQNGDLYSMNGEVSPNLALQILSPQETKPTIDSAQATQIALQAMAKWYQKTPEDFAASAPQLWIYDESLLQTSTRPVELVWRMEVTAVDNSLPVRELVLVNAGRGSISLHFNQIDTAWSTHSLTEKSNLSQDPNPTETPLPTKTPFPTETPLPIETPTPTDTPASTTNTTADGVDALTATTWYVATTGNDSNSCTVTGSPCLTINGAIGKAVDSDTIKVATGNYTGTGTEVVLINKSVTLSGGWNAGFTTQSGRSTIDGQATRRGVVVNGGVTATVERFVVQNGNFPSDGNTSYGGGGIQNLGTLTLSNSIVRNNTSGSFGGGIHNFGTLTLNNSTVNGNTSDNHGGGGISSGGTLTVNNSTFSGNTAAVNCCYQRNGGGIYIFYGPLTLNNSTISENTAGNGGGIYNGGGPVILTNTLLSGNTASNNSGADCYGSISSSGYNLIGNISGCSFSSATGDKLNVNPQLGVFLPTQGYYPLRSNSPAIDAGNLATCLLTDQRNVSRVGTCDIGSYEYTTPLAASSLIFFSGSPQRAVPLTIFANLLKVVVLDSLGSPVSGVTVTFTAPNSGASGTFADTSTRTTTANTDADGVATSAAFTANGIQGNFVVSATASGVAASVDFSLTNVLWYVATTGNDSNSCTTTGSPCLTINGAIGKATSGDTMRVATGTYIGSGTEVVLINKSVTLSGGWNASFTTQSGTSTIDGQSLRQGIVANISTTVVIDHFTVQNGLSSGNGGGIYTEGDLTLNNSTVTNSTASQYGGGIASGALTINNSIISNNTAGAGGGISSGYATLNNTSVINNHATADGGGIWTGGNLILNGSAIKDNTATEEGGGVFIYVTNSLTLNNSTITGNQARNGGGIDLYNYSSGGAPQQTTILNSTVSNNIAQAGGGINMEYSSPARIVTVRNSIIANNIAPTAADCSGSIGTSDHNIIGSTSGCTVTLGTGDQFNVNPLISASAIGSPAYHFLLSGSPAIDAGASCLSTDQRGVVRPQGAACDIGSYEKTTAGVAASFGILSGSNQRIAPLNPFAPLSVYVVDNLGTPVSGVNITFTAPAAGASGIFSGSGTNANTVPTDSSGIATASTFTANSQLGSYNVNATASGLAGSVNFALTNVVWYVSPSGNDSNNCATAGTPCLTINGAIGKAVAGDTINVAVGTYTGSGTEVVLISKSVILAGGWNAAFTTQSGSSTIDGQNARRGVFLNSGSVTASLNRFIVKNGSSGIYNVGNLIVNNSSIQNNNDSGIYNTGSLVLNNSTVSNNSGSNGGGITNIGSLTVNNTTISGNSDSQTGGIQNTGSLTLNNSTISNNSGNSFGGILNSGGSASVKNSIIASNLSGGASQNCAGTISSSGYNLIGNNSGCTFSATTGDLVGTGASPIKPRLNALQDNGGSTFTHALGIGSPAIDAGNPATCLATDQRGVARPVGAKCDIGAYEGSVPWVPVPFVNTFTANLSSSLPGSFLCDQTQPNCTNGSNSHADAAHKFAIGTHNFYATKFLRDSIDNKGMTIISTVQYCEPGFVCPYSNAFWDGTQMVYGSAYGFPLADDVVAHELTHGVTEYESNLFYYYQSGAINESFSDLWGEYYDQGNGLGTDTLGVKWLVGEDVSGLGAIRSMSNPPTYGDPDKMTSPNYYTGSDDNGGVHWNSGVNNKAVFLMVDGGSFNGKTVSAIGWEKTGAIYYEVNTNVLTSGSDYSDLYYALQQACTNLIGQKGIVAGDCTQVKNAIDAVEMNIRQPLGNLEDPSFEYSYATYPYWDQTSTNFGSPLCTMANCSPYGNGGTAGPRTGSVWGWFGGTTDYEAASLSQTVYFPDGYPALKLKFYLWIGIANAGSDANDKFIAQVDGVTVFSANATQKSSYSTYQLVSVDIGAFANGDFHTITFSSVTTGQVVNFNLDDVSLFDNSYEITGTTGIAGVTLNYVDGISRTVISNKNGGYFISVPQGWSGMVTPSKVCYSFAPVNRVYSNITTNQTAQDFAATLLTYTISGKAGVAGASLWYMDNGPKTVTADGSGNYTITVPCGWSGVVTPYKSGYTFTPVSKSYSNVQSNQSAQDYTATACASCADINVLIGGNLTGAYTLGPSQSTRQTYPLDTGPAKVTSANGVPIIGALREALVTNGAFTTFGQMMGLPNEQLDDVYWFPAYNNQTLSGQLRFANVGVADTTVTVTIGGIDRGNYLLHPNESKRVTYDLDTGPVKVWSTGGVPIVAALRDALLKNGAFSDFHQLMGLPDKQLSDTYWFPAYNNQTLSGQLRFGNVGVTDTTVTVTIGGIDRGSYLLHPNESKRVTYDLDTGPVKVWSTGGVPIVAALRDALVVNGGFTTFAQLMGLPKEQLSDTYLFPAYNNQTLSGQLRFANVGVADTTVTVTIGGIDRGSYLLHPNEGKRVTYDLDTGPVVVHSSGGVPIVAALRDALVANGTFTTFAQLMGLPDTQLSSTYWFPAYNNVTLSGQLRFGVP